MTKVEQLTAAAEALSEQQLDALISLARSMKERPFYAMAPPEALEALDRGLAEIAAGKAVSGKAVLDRIDARLKSRGA